MLLNEVILVFLGLLERMSPQILSTQMRVTCCRELTEKSMGTSNIERQLNVGIINSLNYFKVLNFSYHFLI